MVVVPDVSVRSLAFSPDGSALVAQAAPALAFAKASRVDICCLLAD